MDWIAWLVSLPPGARDRALDACLGTTSSEPPGTNLVGYHASGVAAITRALVAAPVGPADVLVDLGAGLGKVLLLARQLTTALVRGIEIQGDLAARARALDLDVTHADVRDADLSDGTVFFLYNPFDGPVVDVVVERLRLVAAQRDIVVCALGITLRATWLIPRPTNDFWLQIYDSRIAGARPRPHSAAAFDERTHELMAEP